jgi:hypothetical protein
MTIHELKIWPEYFYPVSKGIKTFEVRKNDRGIKVGDVLKLREWNDKLRQYTGQEVQMKVTYMLDWMYMPGYSVMAIIPYAGRKCQTCGDYCEDEGECCAQERSHCTITPVGGFDEDDPMMIKPLECWQGVDTTTGPDGA